MNAGKPDLQCAMIYSGTYKARERRTLTLWVCYKDLYPNIHKMLTIAVTWPVSSCEYERSFSGLRRLNTYLRATQTSERLDSLALIHIHRSHQYDMEELIDRFSRMHPRRMELTNVLHEVA